MLRSNTRDKEGNYTNLRERDDVSVSAASFMSMRRIFGGERLSIKLSCSAQKPVEEELRVPAMRKNSASSQAVALLKQYAREIASAQSSEVKIAFRQSDGDED